MFCQRGLTEALATLVCSRALSLCRMENMSCSHVRYKRRQALVSFFHGRAFFYIGYLLCGHFLNVSDHKKRLLFLFIKWWLRSSQKQPPYFSTLLTPTPSLLPFRPPYPLLLLPSRRCERGPALAQVHPRLRCRQ